MPLQVPNFGSPRGFGSATRFNASSPNAAMFGRFRDKHESREHRPSGGQIDPGHESAYLAHSNGRASSSGEYARPGDQLRHSNGGAGYVTPAGQGRQQFSGADVSRHGPEDDGGRSPSNHEGGIHSDDSIDSPRPSPSTRPKSVYKEADTPVNMQSLDTKLETQRNNKKKHPKSHESLQQETVYHTNAGPQWSPGPVTSEEIYEMSPPHNSAHTAPGNKPLLRSLPQDAHAHAHTHTHTQHTHTHTPALTAKGSVMQTS